MKLTLLNKILMSLLFLFLLYFFWARYTIPFGINIDRVAVIKETKALQRMETASFTIEKIVDAGTNGNVIQEFLYGDKVLLIAHGQVVAGFDLAALKDENVIIQARKITVVLPDPIILYTRLDNEQTKVYDRTRGLLAPKNSDLEARARAAAETSIKSAACEGGILGQARENGIKQMTLFFKSLGFTDITITSGMGSC